MLTAHAPTLPPVGTLLADVITVGRAEGRSHAPEKLVSRCGLVASDDPCLPTSVKVEHAEDARQGVAPSGATVDGESLVPCVCGRVDVVVRVGPDLKPEGSREDGECARESKRVGELKIECIPHRLASWTGGANVGSHAAGAETAADMWCAVAALQR